MQRRSFLTFAALAATAPLASRLCAAGRSAFADDHPPIGIQLYMLAADLDADFDGTLRRVASIGYQTVELAGLHGRTPKEMRAALDRAGLICRSAHIPAEQTGGKLSLENTGAVAEMAHAIGITNIVMPVFLFPKDFRPPVGATPIDAFRAAGRALRPDDYKRLSAFLNERGEAFAAEGLMISYHNHNFEFAPQGETTGYDILLAETDPRLVAFELDVGWAEAAGINTTRLLRAHPKRFTQIHIKDIRASTKVNYDFRQDPIEVGSGIIDWPHILPVALEAGVRGLYVEQEPPYLGPRLESAAKSFAYLRRLVGRSPMAERGR